MTLYSAALTLFLVMDPFGNIPLFLPLLKSVEPARRNWVILRESLIAFLILVVFLYCGRPILKGMNISESALEISGGIILFIIAIGMIFPKDKTAKAHDNPQNEPFIVPMAIPLIAGPSALSTIMLLGSQSPGEMSRWLLALIIASGLSTLILLSTLRLQRYINVRHLLALERLMGMVLVAMAVERFLFGVKSYFHA